MHASDTARISVCATALVLLLLAPAAAPAQPAEPIRLGLLTVKTGPLAAGGIQMDQGLNVCLKEHDGVLAGRPVEIVLGDTGGNPAGAKTKAQELVERDHVDAILGPLAAFEAYAINDYIREAQMPTLPVAAAEDLTQRKANPWMVRVLGTSAQDSHAMADYAATALRYKRIITIADDFAYGHETVAGFQRVFEDHGGKIVKKLWPPLNTADYNALSRADRADPVCRRRVHGLRRLEPGALHQAIRRIRPASEGAAARQRHCRRCADPAPHWRGGGGHRRRRDLFLDL